MSFVAVGAAAVVAGGAIAASSIQSSSARRASETQAESADLAIALQREQWQQARRDIAPWRRAGIRGLAQVERLARQGPPQMAPFTAPRRLDPRQFAFEAPTAEDLRRDPSYEFRLLEGQRALERSAAARGGVLSGGTARGLERYAQDYASTEYGNVYNRALGENQLRYGRALTGNEQQYQRALQQYQTRYNVGMGQYQAELAPWQTLAYGGQAATSGLSQLGAQYSGNISELLQAQGNALAAGTVGSANAIAGGIAGVSNAAQQGLSAYYLGQQQQPSAGYNPNAVPYNPWAY